MRYRNLLILGASGQTGQKAVQLATSRGYKVTVLIRSKGTFDGVEGINVIEGSVLDSVLLDKAMSGQDAVLSFLGIKRQNPSNPWSAVDSPKDFMESVAEKVAASMKKENIRRLVILSAAGVGESRSKINPLMRFVIWSSNIKVTYNDLEKMEELLRGSDIDSLAVQPVGLVDRQNNQEQAQIVSYFKMSSTISRSDVACWMLNALDKEKAPGFSSEMIGWG